MSDPRKVVNIPPAPNVGQPQRRRKPSLLRALVWSALLYAVPACIHGWQDHKAARHWQYRVSTRPLRDEETLFLTIPNGESAIEASRAYANHPHVAGSKEDFEDAKVFLKFLQDQLGISAPPESAIFKAGSEESRNATLRLTDRGAKPSAWIDTYFPVLNTPLDHSLEILDEDGSAIWTANLEEEADPLDKDVYKYRDAVPAFHGLSKNGTAVGQLIYANYGTKEEYDELEAAGADFTGKIVITRYGGVYRSLKILRAQELGAAAVLMYNDPRDDGYVTVENGFEPYPQGPARNPTSLERGGVPYATLYPGDPTTPGKPAYADSERVEAVNLPTIPSLPISWQNAQRLFQEIGDVYKVDESGKKKLTGNASKLKVKLVNHVDDKVTPIWNTMASIPGHIRNEVVIIGCHRDAWGLGGADPVSGTVSLHEVIRGFGVLLKHGWKPLRTVVFASWDAEEYSLVGSTEWGEDFPEWIQAHAVAYHNLDTSVEGSRWQGYGSPSLAALMKQTAKDVPHPSKERKSLWDARNDIGPFTPESGLLPANATIDAEYLERHKKVDAVEINPLGSGSDFTVFLQRLGVASTHQGFEGTPNDPPNHMHSIYDSQRWQELVDPGFSRHVAVAKHLGLMALRTIDSIILPIDTTSYAHELENYLSKVRELAQDFDEKNANGPKVDFAGVEHAIKKVQSASKKLDKEKLKAEKKIKKIFDQLHRTDAHQKLKKIPDQLPRPDDHPQPLFSRIIEQIRDSVEAVFRAKARDYVALEGDEALALAESLELDEDGSILSAEWLALNDEPHRKPFPIRKLIKAAKRVKAANDKLMAFERGFLSQDGIKDREWYKHLGVAPGKWLGYGATTFPALTEALTDSNNVTLAQYEADRLASLLKELAKAIHP